MDKNPYADIAYPKHLTLEWLVSKGLPIYVRNMTRPRGSIAVNFMQANVRAKVVKIPRTNLPIHFDRQLSPEILLDSEDLRQCVRMGVLELVRPDVAWAELAVAGTDGVLAGDGFPREPGGQDAAGPQTAWEHDFHARMAGFEAAVPGTGTSVSVKVRVTSGCFHREHSPRAYEMIDRWLQATPDRCRFEEHESGPELLVWVAVGTAAITLAKSVIDLVTAIIKARADGVRHGDHPSDPVELIVRVTSEKGVREERLVRFSASDSVTGTQVGRALTEGISKLLPPRPETGTASSILSRSWSRSWRR
ncbi:MAG: hypothetical protein HY903_20015 [Deltaproteobacteria bacterium]|nr:hypothetical protein [Deltaproteobacteria bacterium]